MTEEFIKSKQIRQNLRKKKKLLTYYLDVENCVEKTAKVGGILEQIVTYTNTHK